MHVTAITPSIAVTIGRQMRLFHAFVTTAPAVLDAPSTLTLYLATLSDVCGLAAEPNALTRRAPAHRPGWCSSTLPSSIGNGLDTARGITCSRQQIPCSSG